MRRIWLALAERREVRSLANWAGRRLICLRLGRAREHV
jgi:hypothetical protein